MNSCEDAQKVSDWRAIDKFLEEADGPTIEALMGTHGFRHCTMGPGTVLVCPGSYVVLEKTLALSTFGLKKTLVPNTVSAFDVLAELLRTQTSPSRGPTLTIDIAKKVLELRAKSQQPAQQPFAETQVAGVAEAQVVADTEAPQGLA